MPTKPELEQELKDLHVQYQNLNTAYQAMIRNSEEAFLSSPLYRTMEESIARERAWADFERHAYEHMKEQYALLHDQYTSLRKAAEAQGKGIIPFHQTDPEDIRDASELRNELIKTTARCDALEDTIKYLRNVLAGFERGKNGAQAEGCRKRPGAPRKIGDAARKRMRELRDEGYSIREIAEKEGVSTGTVSSIIRKGKSNG